MNNQLWLRIQKIYFEEILKGTKKIEYRANRPFFQVRLKKNPTVLNLICGPRKAAYKITKIKLIQKPAALSGFSFLETPQIFAIHLGGRIQ